MVEDDEHTILSRIRYPDKSVVLLHGKETLEIVSFIHFALFIIHGFVILTQ